MCYLPILKDQTICVFQETLNKKNFLNLCFLVFFLVYFHAKSNHDDRVTKQQTSLDFSHYPTICSGDTLKQGCQLQARGPDASHAAHAHAHA